MVQMVQTSEVTINRQQVQDVQHVTETVKREELRVKMAVSIHTSACQSNPPAANSLHLSFSNFLQ
jgi:stress response protein YsnF